MNPFKLKDFRPLKDVYLNDYVDVGCCQHTSIIRKGMKIISREGNSYSRIIVHLGDDDDEVQQLNNELDSCIESFKQINSDYVMKYVGDLYCQLGDNTRWLLFELSTYKLLESYIGKNSVFTFDEIQFFVHDIVLSVQTYPVIQPLPTQIVLSKLESSPIPILRLVPIFLQKRESFEEIIECCDEEDFENLLSTNYIAPEILKGDVSMFNIKKVGKEHVFTIAMIIFSLSVGKTAYEMNETSAEKFPESLTVKGFTKFDEPTNKLFDNFFEKALVIDSTKRISFEELLNDPFIKNSINFKEIMIGLNNDNEAIESKYQTKNPPEILGKGAFGVVYKAYIGGDLSNPVAVKECGEEGKDLLLREVVTMKLCQHPNLVKFYDYFTTETSRVGKEGKRYHMVMEYCDMGDLDNYMLKQERLTLNKEEIGSFLSDIANALNYLHFEKRMVHRDLKPSNFMLKRENDTVVLKLCDYGFARSILDDKMSTFTGTRQFEPPEFFLMKQYSSKSDLFAVGVILYKMAIGVYPFTISVCDDNWSQPKNISFPFDFPIDSNLKNLIICLTACNENERMCWDQFYLHPFVQSISNTQLTIPSISQFELHNKQIFK
ncbi:myosin light chain kinase [Entamoeba marina]